MLTVQVLLVLVQVKAGVGATGIMLFINTRTNQCCVARLGDSMPFVAASKGGSSLKHSQQQCSCTGQSASAAELSLQLGYTSGAAFILASVRVIPLACTT
jgi:hypothetical protein